MTDRQPDQMAIFDLRGPLPEVGITLLEASAGTGKTFAIAALSARLIAAGHQVQDLLLVTFTRAAANELRSKVRARLESSALAVRTFQIDGRLPQDEVDALLCEGSDLDLTVERLERAVSDIDLATIATLHEYSSRMLSELGLLADHDPGSVFVDDLRGVIAEVVEDVIAAGGYRPRKKYDPNWLSRAHHIGQQVCEFPSWQIIPTDHGDKPFAEQVRTEFEARKRRIGVHGYPDMVARLEAALTDPHTAQLAAELLSKRFPVVLVDEFQDTDPSQWEILHRAFAERSVVVLIGDPKQAIYGFRGGDVETYLRARASAKQVVTMDTNYRSDPAVVHGIEQLFAGASLGTKQSPIRLHPMRPKQPAARLFLNEEPIIRAVQIRQLPLVKNGVIFKARERVENDLVVVISELLGGNCTLQVRPDRSRTVRASDIAVLVNTNHRGKDILDRLNAAGIAATFTGSESIFTSQAALDWLDLLEALSTGRVAASRRAALTSFFGYDSRQLAEADDAGWSEIFSTLREQARLLTTSSVMAVFESLLASNDLYRRLLAQRGGERLLTDLRHVAEILNQAQRRGSLTAAELTGWLHDRIANASTGDSRERVRKLDTDRDAVTIATVHQAKGMEYPIVLLPEFGEKFSGRRRQEVVIGHQDQLPVIDLGPSNERLEDYSAEEAAEELRDAYVACTRARSLLLTWEMPTAKDSQHSALNRLLRNQNPPGQPPAPCYENDDPLRVWDRSLIDFTPVPDSPSEIAPDVPSAQTPSNLSVRAFTRVIDRQWTRTSYTGLTAGLHEASMGPLAVGGALNDPDDEADEPIQPDQLDSQVDQLAPSMSTPTDRASVDPVASMLAPLPGGTHFGSVVHEILERVDPGATDLRQEVTTHSAQVLQSSGRDDIDLAALAAGLEQVLTTDLGILTAGRSLADLGKANQLTEFGFEMPMGLSRQVATLADLARLMDDPQLVDPTGTLAGYGSQLASSPAGVNVLRGYLTGSIDVVLRAETGGQPRFVVLDYKTNRIASAGDQLRPEHYGHAAMEQIMRDSHYPLQALLYCVALHRYLGRRLVDYDPRLHLGGVGYLFVRGMAGPNTPRDSEAPCGVFTWRPDPAMVVRASQVLAGEQ